ncbi:hypothetical protein D3C72_145560 [compost metagenome]
MHIALTYIKEIPIWLALNAGPSATGCDSWQRQISCVIFKLGTPDMSVCVINMGQSFS